MSGRPVERAPFWWFQGASVVELAERLAACGPATARLEVRLSEDRKLTFRVVPTQKFATAMGDPPEPPDINESFLCPPICPE
jgi:hypothetical protein